MAPYATVWRRWSIPTLRAKNVVRLAEVGALGRYGFYEALDYTPARSGRANCAIVRAFMAHHQGMTIVAIANAVLDARMRRGFRPSRSALPPGVKMTSASDCTQTIRASVADVQFILLLTIGLVVMVIFLFLRKAWATIIPAIAVPISLVGTFGVMFLLGYSLDNLSLMGLTIAVGFVVDDAIVMVENIMRHIEAGQLPFECGHARRVGNRLHQRRHCGFGPRYR